MIFLPWDSYCFEIPMIQRKGLMHFPHKSITDLAALPHWMIISPDDKWSLYAAISLASAMGLNLERRNIVEKSLSGPVSAMLFTAILTNVGILPASGSIHITLLQSFIVRLATPLLLLGADMKKIFRETGVLLQAFLCGTLGTVIGSLVGYIFLTDSLNVIGSNGDGWKIVSALTAKNIGGGLNFLAVIDSLKVSPAVVGVALAIDNILGLIYFPFISALASNIQNDTNIVGNTRSVQTLTSISTSMLNSTSSDTQIKKVDEAFNAESYLFTLSIGFFITAIGERIESLTDISSITITTILAVLLATFGSNILPLKMIIIGENIGKLLLFLYFGSIGNSSGTITSVINSTTAWTLLQFGLILYICHLVIIYFLAHIVLNIPKQDILLASNANIGNAATATALASSMNWQSRLLPGLLVGTFGNAVGTLVGLFIGKNILQK